jgi:malonyl-ACP decarboxylase
MPEALLATGAGVVSAIGVGKAAFFQSLMQGRQQFGYLEREGRKGHGRYIGAELSALPDTEATLDRRLFRTASLSSVFAALAIDEAWQESALSWHDPARIGLIVGGSNLQQRENYCMQQRYAERPFHLPPTYGFSFLDTDIAGVCSQHFGIRGFAHCVGGASASGQLSIIKAAEAVQSGVVDACIAVGALSDLSHWECQGLRAVGAMGSDRFADEPARACRPFDEQHDGFIFGEASAAIVIERESTVALRDVRPYARLSGWSYNADGHRHPDPGFVGCLSAAARCMSAAGVTAVDVDYVNPHGTGSAVGDANELRVLGELHLQGASINTTKSITGHGLSAAGAVEFVTCMLQMAHSRLHPCVNLERPIDNGFNWVLDGERAQTVHHALNLSTGFGGINTATMLSRI